MKLLNVPRLCVLGGCRVRGQDGHESRPKTLHERRLVALLALHEDKGLNRQQVAAALWPGSTPEMARQSLRTALHSVRNLVGNGLWSDRHRIGLNLELCTTDILEFERRLRDGNLSEAADIFAGPVGGPDSPDLADEELDALWDYARASSVAEAFQDACLQLALVAGREGKRDREHEWFERALNLDRADEAPYLAYMRALQGSGRPEEAFRLFRRMLAVLEARRLSPSTEALELGRSARAQMRESAVRIQAEDPRADADGPQHRFGPAVGLEPLLAQIEAALRSSRLVTLVGSGGVGKTRAVAEAAAQMGPLRLAKSLSIELAPVDNPASLSAAIERQCELQGFRVKDLQARDVLVVIDNCEHLLDSARDWIRNLLQHSIRLSVLATSRVALGLPQEQVIEVPPMGALAGTLMRLRLEMAGVRGTPDHQIQALCDRCGGLPLAVELAATELATHGFDVAIQRWSEDVPHSIEEMIRPSVDRLPPDGRQALLELSVFPDSFSEFEAQWVTPHSLASLAAVSLIQVGRSTEPWRYRFLPPVRRWSAAELGDRGTSVRQRLARSASEWLLEKYQLVRQGRLDEFASAVSLSLPLYLDTFEALSETEPVQAIWVAHALAPVLNKLGLAKETVRLYESVMDRALAADERQASRALINLGPSAKTLGQTDLALKAYGIAGEMGEREGRHRDVGVCHLNASFVHVDLGQYREAELALESAQAAFDAHAAEAEPRETEFAQMNVFKSRARLQVHCGQYEASRDSGLAALGLARKLGDKHSEAVVQNNLGDASLLMGEFDAAAEHYAENCTVARVCGDPGLLAHGQLGSALIAVVRGETEPAKDLLRSALLAFEVASAEREVLTCCQLAAAIAGATGDHRLAVKLNAAVRHVLSEKTFSPNHALESVSSPPVRASQEAVGALMARRFEESSCGLTTRDAMTLAKQVLGCEGQPPSE